MVGSLFCFLHYSMLYKPKLTLWSFYKGLLSVVWFTTALVFLVPNKIYADYNLYLDQLRLMNIAVDDYLDDNSDNVISRYDLAKLLNTVECKDCIHPDSDMIQKYTQAFWENFTQLPGEDFDEISYLWGLYNQESYYYCVAYVGDHNYMRGYPQDISPICAGMFCGAKSVTKAEFIQVIINLLSEYIFPQYSANWKQMSKRVQRIKIWTQADTYVDANDRTLIKQKALDCPEWSCKLENAREFKSYLKYCMFNLKACNMQAFGKIGQAYRPVAELNILYNQNIIDYNEASKEDLSSPAKWNIVLETLYKLYQFVDCSFNNDYDCDTLDNAHDNCPNKYNPRQWDIDQDGIWDVCDDDIDGDGILNPVWIIDEWGRLNISVATTGMDNCLLTANPQQTRTQHPFIWDACFDEQDRLALYIAPEHIKTSAPTEVSFDAITKWTWESIQRNMWDGTQLSREHVRHYYSYPGPYTISAIAHGPRNDASAKVSIILGENNAEYHALQLLTNKLWSDGPDKIVLASEYAGQSDEIVWDFNDGTPSVSKSAWQQFNKFFEHKGEFPVHIQSLSNGQIIGNSQIVIGIGDDYDGLALKADTLQLKLNQKITVQSSAYGFTSKDIKYIQWDFGDGYTISNKATQMSHTYQSVWQKTISQTVFLNNGKRLMAYINVFVYDPRHTTSHTLQLSPHKLRLKKWEKSFFTVVPLWDKLSESHSLEYQDKDFDVSRVFAPFSWPFYSKASNYYKEGIYHPRTRLIINQCQSLEAQASIVVHGLDLCLEALLQGDLDQFKCDMDGDEIPDICDNDIDGDGVENLIWVINYENDDCSIDPDNVNTNLLDQHVQWVCTLDNCPFTINTDQNDLNINHIWDICENSLPLLLTPNHSGATPTDNSTQDSDNDGIGDSSDQCPLLAENYNGINDLDGCPEIDTSDSCTPYENTCTDVLCPWACYSCPCQFADYISDLAPWDKIKAKLFDLTRKYFYDESPVVLIDDYVDF